MCVCTAAYICEIYAVKKGHYMMQIVCECVRFARGDWWEGVPRLPPVRKSYSFVPTLVVAVYLFVPLYYAKHTLSLSHRAAVFIIYDRRSAGCAFEDKSLPSWAAPTPADPLRTLEKYALSPGRGIPEFTLRFTAYVADN